ncbi:hypothetical protein FBY35_3629 [Streptomyces sp. SLBN-118]|uniref:hypothetical protein n=1 Tax=Streptomyces sp. SLBN-118 TaxID=2768454 RepID=UPI001151D74D|nr:hypothetical protein [Streptomyces sp. SLBN-118]TQK53153.1 hypothetical protein FBY35_3629 [Streptomyces sp. SLBN-118]
MNLRMIGLCTVVLFTTLLPLAASAGPSDGLWPGSGAAPDEAKPKSDARRGPGLLSGLGSAKAPGGGPGERAGGGAGASDTSDAAEPSHVTGATAPQTSARCGPELTSPEGVEAQTCVLREGRDTWARTYYRNATGEELSSVLTLMGPGGRTLQTNCVVEAGDEPNACETPREPSRGPVAQYSAVAEFATADEAGDGPLLLRSGSNSAAPVSR